MNNQGETGLWIDKFFEMIPLPYPLVALIMSIGIYFAFVIFSIASNYEMELSDHMVAISMGFMIGYQMGAMKYLLNILKSLLADLDALFRSDNINIYKSIYYVLFVSYWRYATILCIVLPFYIIDWIPPSYQNIYESFFAFSATNDTIWAIPFDIFMDVVGLLAAILLAQMLWIMFNMTYALRYFRNVIKGADMNVDAQRIKLKMYSIRSQLSTAITLCIISISLAIFSYADPSRFYSVEIEMLLILMFISLIIYYSGIESSQQILRNRITYEINCICKKNHEQVQKLISISEGKENEIGEISKISNMFDALQKQKEHLEGIFPQKYSVKSLSSVIITLIGSFLIPMATGLFKIIIEKNPAILSKINNVTIEIVSNLYPPH